MDATEVLENVVRVAERWAGDRHARQRRCELDPADFAELAAAGVPLAGVDADRGGLFRGVAESTRPVAEILRTLARADASVALVCAMHPAVLAFWHATPEVPEPARAAWSAQRAEVSALAAGGAWFGTITSEPGSGGDVARTAAVARPDGDGRWLLSGRKHFGSGSGVTSFMLTSARPADEDAPDWFLLDVRGVPWDGSRGMELVAPWDGHGMTATQSHGMAFTDFPARRVAWPGHWKTLSDAAGPFVGTIFTAVVVGVVDVAVETARAQLAARRDALRPYEQVEWIGAERDGWLAVQAYEGMLRAVEAGRWPLRTVLLGKTAVADLAESCLRRITRVVGGGSFARHSPFGFWFEDVRALGWLRPPWALGYDALVASAWDPQDRGDRP
jgi:alkylation response protein AidB-like acyl-CoA dehydrogenase